MLSTCAPTVPPMRRWLTSAVAFAVVMTGEGLAIGASASAAQIQASGCREVTATSTPLYYTSTGSVTAPERFYRGNVFRYTATANSRYRTWVPRGVPESQGETRWAKAAGSQPVACPW